MAKAAEQGWQAAPIVGGKPVDGNARPVVSPSDHRVTIGRLLEATPADVDAALDRAAAAAEGWDRTPVGERAACLERAADLAEARMAEAMAIAVREGGKTLPDAVAEGPLLVLRAAARLPDVALERLQSLGQLLERGAR
jgi:RHH-type proline utilization regulon transcriptional repressor/proline dehydrogenase/delta 1-pyrroline-5-carboxylate dehydrogenase